MKRIAALFVLALSLCATAYCQNADEIMRKHIEAIGGSENWNKIKTLKMSGSMSISGVEMKLSQVIVNDKGMRMDMDAMGMKGYTIITPTKGWVFQPGMDIVMQIPDDQLKTSQDKLNVKTLQLADTSLIKTAEFKGMDSVNSASCYKLLITDKEGNTQTAFIDAATYFLVRSEAAIKLEGEEQMIDLNYGNFQKQKEGITLPMSMTGIMGADIVFKTVEINKPVDEKLFRPE